MFNKSPNIDNLIDEMKVQINEEKIKQDEIDRHLADF